MQTEPLSETQIHGRIHGKYVANLDKIWVECSLELGSRSPIGTIVMVRQPQPSALGFDKTADEATANVSPPRGGRHIFKTAIAIRRGVKDLVGPEGTRLRLRDQRLAMKPTAAVHAGIRRPLSQAP
jgi:hypothetical protein